MRVLHLHSEKLYGGVETFLTTLVRDGAFCPQMEHAFGLCCGGRFHDDLQKLGASVTVMGEARLSRPLSILQARAALGRLLRSDYAPDVGVCHMSKPMWVFAPLLRKANIPIVLYLHAPVHAMGPFEKLVRKGAPPDLLIGVSKHTTDQATELIAPQAQTGIINYPMPWPFARYESDASDRAALRQEFTTQDGDVVIVQAARMTEWKGQTNLLAALALLKDTPGWVHWMIGGAQTDEEIAYANALKLMARENGIEERIRFIGQRSDVSRFLAASDIYCQANNQSEGFSLSFTEAFSAGLPIVTTDIGSASEIVSSDTGFLTPLHDAPTLAGALKRLIIDAPLRESMSLAAKKRVRILSDTKQQIELLYTQLGRVAR